MKTKVKTENVLTKRSNSQSESFPRKGNCKKFESVITRAPARGSPEIPILCVLAKSPSGRRTKDVLRELRSTWFKELDQTDLDAVYPESKKGVVDRS